MALKKETIVDQIEIVSNNSIQVRSVVRVSENDEIISESFYRHVLNPGDDITNENPKVQAIANAIWV